MLKEFKKFVLRGNVVDLAVAVVVGSAFSAIVTALVADIITPLIGALYQTQKFNDAFFTIRGSQFNYGHLANAVISFLAIAAVIFFLVVQPVNHLKSRSNRNKTPEEPTERKCPECLSDIPKAAKRCKFCTAKVSPVTK